ncbi:hypothetical protein [Ignicoccus hospitalis]|uniref:Uncharacterized protein n=1 Tax=Ignicoccus hospitalis (strain KIN4/I / DSM 18386 / JCM 14125) TaxID=453591 RepID=A8A8N3_IGNH4|nr:hypothetical protein [Ignicoccus hospitalis]ABU81285.1 hypothetical protein Igni_0101 [Ignicoccus hospitalis KIN4/I]HIH90411.1 hypothetical protein [Desulfurococcaceae archaeon]
MGLRVKVVEALRKTHRTRRRLEAYLYKAKAKERELMEKLVEAQKNGDELRAKVYASEVAKLRKFVESIAALDVKLEHTELKLQSVLMLGDAGAALKPVVNEIKALAAPVRRLLPEIEEEMNDLIETVDELAEEELVGGAYVDVFLDHEAEKILKEAQLIAQKRLEESLAVASEEGSKA